MGIKRPASNSPTGSGCPRPRGRAVVLGKAVERLGEVRRALIAAARSSATGVPGRPHLAVGLLRGQDAGGFA